MEEAVLGSPSLISLTVSVDVKQPCNGNDRSELRCRVIREVDPGTHSS